MIKIPFDLEAYREQMRPSIVGRPYEQVFWDALDFAEKAHFDQWRRSGDAYILHPCSVAKILAEEMDITDPEILAAALLHDTVEDVEEVTSEVVGKHFGSYVQAIVEGCTKVTHRSGNRQADSKLVHRKIFSGAALRPEVMLVKLADRLHNLRTLRAMPRNKRQRIADETLDIYAPLATVFGLFNMKREMYNLALTYKFPKQGAKLAHHIKHLADSETSQHILEHLRIAAKDARLKCEISRRVKDLWAYYDTSNRILLQQIETPIEILILVNSVDDCYRALGVVNQTFRPIPRTIRDFISNPKPTGYQGLHARAIIRGQRFLFKIRTNDMARKAQRGVFRNWNSKQGKQGKFILELQEMLDIIGSDETVSYRELIAAGGMKENYTYTPRGDLICLPIRSIVLDFAFRVHTEIGLTCIGAEIRNQRVGPDYVLQDGQMVNIIRAPEKVAFRQEMLQLCRTPKARAELARSFRLRGQRVAEEIGRLTLQQEMRRYGLPRDLLESEGMSRVAATFALKSKERLFRNIGIGKVRLPEVIENIRQELFSGTSFLAKPTGEFNKIKLNTLDPVFIKLSSCCNPNPVDKANCALLTAKGLSVHNKNCPRLHEIKFQREDAVDISWERTTPITRPQSITFPGVARAQLLPLIASAPGHMNIQDIILAPHSSVDRETWVVHFEVAELRDLQKALRHFDRSAIAYEFTLEF
ncbi:RelA/SpoT family protein [Desulfofustis limnaeus]|jgi:GTP pyrophosphokinase|uniref:GTP pyrophosphokinase n=1 Tax=Desulfofustis limnaeus TaxID=2740163 RepID=A0ABM7WAR6_9BACT|nr:HD domain-containing protein [Desulfofustis limnaeus]MDX9894459.1 HD domain-containing protein [Desulfofustis sp.]BDD88075.1 GTP pyrophosphokinase [Desulfofustis limnaeus]